MLVNVWVAFMRKTNREKLFFNSDLCLLLFKLVFCVVSILLNKKLPIMPVTIVMPLMVFLLAGIQLLMILNTFFKNPFSVESKN